jgi:hypothetical protein
LFDPLAPSRVEVGPEPPLGGCTRRHLDHTISAEEPELVGHFIYPPDATTYQAFLTAATSILAEAESRKDLLVKHGLAEEMLSGLRLALEQFQTAVDQRDAGRLAHVGASADLVAVSEQAVQVVKVMNGLVRVRVANQPDRLADVGERQQHHRSPAPGGRHPDHARWRGEAGRMKGFVRWLCPFTRTGRFTSLAHSPLAVPGNWFRG